MAITRVQKNTNAGTSITAISAGFNNPTTVNAGDLVIVMCVAGAAGSQGFVAGDCTKSSGTCVLDTITLEKANDYNDGSSWTGVGVWSAPVLTAGTCTMQIGNLFSTSWATIEIIEYAGANVTASRMGGTPAANSGTGTAADSGNVQSGGAGVFMGVLGVDASVSITITKDAAFLLLDQYTNGASQECSSYIEQIVSANTLDSASWTITSDPWNAACVFYKEAGVALPGYRM